MIFRVVLSICYAESTKQIRRCGRHDMVHELFGAPRQAQRKQRCFELLKLEYPKLVIITLLKCSDVQKLVGLEWERRESNL